MNVCECIFIFKFKTSLIFQHTWWDRWMFDATVDQLVWHQQPASPSPVDPVSIEWEFVGIIVHRCSHDIWYLSLSSASSVSHITMIRGMSSFGCGTLPCSSFDQTRSPPTLTCVMKFLWHVNNDDDDQTSKAPVLINWVSTMLAKKNTCRSCS